MTLRRSEWWRIALCLLPGLLCFALLKFGLDFTDKISSPAALIVTIGFSLQQWSQSRASAAEEEVRAARQALLDEVRHRAGEFLGDTQVLRPAVMPLRWRRTSLPGVSSPHGSDLADYGDVADLYRAFTGQRLVILGEAGIGKTCAVNRMIVDLLDAQRRTGGGGPVSVPVLVGPQDWDPGKAGFESWLVDRIVKEYCRGDAKRHSDRIGTLVRRGEILLFLDGLDDLAPAGRAAILHELNLQETVTVVLCCRTGDYQDTASQQRLHGATVIELHGLAGPEIIDYLRQCQADPPPAHWQTLLDELSDSPSSPLMQALANPLMLAILRDTHDSTRPLSVRDFPIRHAAEDELLDRFITHAYTRRFDGKNHQPTAEQACRTLGYLARRLEAKGRRQFGWWEIESLLPLPSRILCAAATDGRQFGVILAVLTGLTYRNWRAVVFGFVFGLPVALIMAAPFGRNSKREIPEPKRLTRFRPKVFIDSRRWDELASMNLRWWATGGAVLLVVLAGITLYWHRNDPEMRRPAVVVISLLAFAVLGALAAPTAFAALAAAHALIGGLFDAFLIPVSDDGIHLDPYQIWLNDRKASRMLDVLLPSSLWIGGIVFGWIFISPIPFGIGLLLIGLGVLGIAILSFLIGGSARETAKVAFVVIRLHSRSRVGGMPLLEDARRRGILRAAGPRYEFRHARLQQRLALVGKRPAAETRPAVNHVLVSRREP